MKKNFSIDDPKHKPEQKLNLIKGELKKYFARERRKELPEEYNFWSFDCRVGRDMQSSVTVEEKNLKKEIDKLVADGVRGFYIEILSRPEKK